MLLKATFLLWTLVHLVSAEAREPCLVNPCLNNGTCISRPTDKSYTCQCLEGYEGKDCQTESADVRLVGGISNCIGILEMKHQKEWRPVDGRSDWNLKSSSLVCRQLDCGSAFSRKWNSGFMHEPVWRISSSCVGSESSLRECGKKVSGNSTSRLEVICSDLPFNSNITFFSSSTNGVSEGQHQGPQVMEGYSFSFSCSIQPQYPGGSFHLSFTGPNTTHNYTQPAVNHYSKFLFPAADHTHQGNYSCIYHINVHSNDFYYKSQFLSVTVTEVEPFLIIAANSELLKISLDGSSSTVLKQDLELALALDFDYKQQMIYWIEWNTPMISRMYINGSDVQVLHNTLIVRPSGLAVDWVAGNLYWCDVGRKTIEVSKLNGLHRTVLVNTGLEKPDAMAVDVRYGYLYWSEVDDNNIGRIGMDGTNRSIIVKYKMAHGLTLDYISDRIYWADAVNERIEFANLDGTNRSSVLRQDGLVITGITVFEDHIYYIDWGMWSSSICKANKTQGTNKITLHRNRKEQYDIRMYHPHQQPEVAGHPCQTDNGGCSNLCLLSPGGGYKCSCPTNTYLAADSKQCMSKCTASQFLCKNEKCIPLEKKCDTVDDCGDRSDEPADC